MKNIVQNRLLSANVCLFFIFIVSVIVDSINGYLQVQKGINLPIGILYRLCVVLLISPSLLQTKKVFYFTLFLLPVLLLIILYWNIINNVSIIGEIEVLIRVIYIYLFVNYFYANYEKYNKQNLYKYISNYGLIIAIIIIICFFFGWGNKTYGEDYGFGTKAFFKAGNDLGLVLVFTLLFSFLNYVKYNSNWLSLLRMFIIFVGCILVGSRVSIILSTLFLIFSIFYFLFVFYRRRRKWFLSILIISLIFYAVPLFAIYIYNQFDNYAIDRFSVESMQGARSILIDAAILYIKSLEGFSLIVGGGSGPLYHYVANFIQYSGGDEKTVEADWYEYIGAYGFVLGTFFLLGFYYIVWKTIKRWIAFGNIENFSYVVLSIIFVVVGSLAGHAAQNSMIAPIYGAMGAFVLQKKYQ